MSAAWPRPFAIAAFISALPETKVDHRGAVFGPYGGPRGRAKNRKHRRDGGRHHAFGAR